MFLILPINFRSDARFTRIVLKLLGGIAPSQNAAAGRCSLHSDLFHDDAPPQDWGRLFFFPGTRAIMSLTGKPPHPRCTLCRHAWGMPYFVYGGSTDSLIPSTRAKSPNQNTWLDRANARRLQLCIFLISVLCVGWFLCVLKWRTPKLWSLKLQITRDVYFQGGSSETLWFNSSSSSIFPSFPSFAVNFMMMIWLV